MTLLDRVGALHAQTSFLTSWVQAAIQSSNNNRPPHIYIYDIQFKTVVCGALIHSPAGTGKTLFAKVISQASGSHVEVVSSSASTDAATDAAAPAIHALDTAFGRARRRGPSIVVLDDVDAVAPRPDSAAHDGGSYLLVTAALLALLDPTARGQVRTSLQLVPSLNVTLSTRNSSMKAVSTSLRF